MYTKHDCSYYSQFLRLADIPFIFKSALSITILLIGLLAVEFLITKGNGILVSNHQLTPYGGILVGTGLYSIIIFSSFVVAIWKGSR